MAKWSVALFGYLKPRYYIIEKEYDIRVATFRDKPYWNGKKKQWEDGLVTFPEHVYKLHNCTGCEKRAEPGDVVDFKPWSPDVYWTETEKKEYLIVVIDGPTEPQMEALCEHYWDLDSYRIYGPMPFGQWYNLMRQKSLGKANSEKAADLLGLYKNKWYEDYINSRKEECRLPEAHFKKNRFHIPLNDLISLGVDEAKMLNKQETYDQELPIILKTGCYDKLRTRYISESDGLNLIKPLTDGELKIGLL